jgi:hypothetical protein
MIRKVVFALLICFLTLKIAIAQPDPVEWGRLSPADMELHNYSQDTNAPALILCDYGRLSIEVIDDQYKVVLKRFKRIKIFNKSAYPEANIELLFNRADKEYICDIKAESFSPLARGGSEVSILRDQDIFEKEVDDSWNKKVLAIPNVMEGSVIEFSYTLISNDFFNYRTWSFQSQLPCLWSELRAELSGVYNYMVLLHNVKESLFINEKTDDFKTIPDQMLSNTNLRIPIRVKSTLGRYVMKDIQPLVEEPFITCLQDYRMEVRFQLFSVSRPYNYQQNVIRSWPELVQRLNEDQTFGQWNTKGVILKELVSQIIKDKSRPESKLRAIYDYLRTHFRWNREYRVVTKKTLDEVLKEKNGNSAELNLLMLQMLRLAGLHALPVIISTRSHGKVQKESPILNQFNHIICQVKSDTDTYLLDVIDSYRPFNLLSIEDLNSTGLAIDGENYDWITVANTYPTKRNSLLTLKMDSSGNIHGYLVIYETGHFAHARRANIASMEQEKLIEYLMNFFNMDFTIDTFSIQNRDEIESPIKITLSFFAKKAIDYMFQKDVIYFDAMISNNNSTRINPLKQPVRKYPVDFSFPYEESSTLVVQVPKGYIFEELPDEEHYIMPDESAEFQFQVFNTTKVFQVKSTIKIKKSTFSVAEYQDLKLLFDRRVQKNSEQVIAVRK